MKRKHIMTIVWPPTYVPELHTHTHTQGRRYHQMLHSHATSIVWPPIYLRYRGYTLGRRCQQVGTLTLIVWPPIYLRYRGYTLGRRYHLHHILVMERLFWQITSPFNNKLGYFFKLKRLFTKQPAFLLNEGRYMEYQWLLLTKELYGRYPRSTV